MNKAAGDHRLLGWSHEQHVTSTCSEPPAHTPTHTHSPWADPHEGDGGAGEEDREEEEGLPPPDIRQSTNQRSREKGQEALREARGQESDEEKPSRPEPP